jgi:hypothetical protein
MLGIPYTTGLNAARDLGARSTGSPPSVFTSFLVLPLASGLPPEAAPAVRKRCWISPSSNVATRLAGDQETSVLVDSISKRLEGKRSMWILEKGRHFIMWHLVSG